jgi:uncharacterized protein involved in exopolysaccharide biosynthesis/Mrp family chromosome partitioning ATPase
MTDRMPSSLLTLDRPGPLASPPGGALGPLAGSPPGQTSTAGMENLAWLWRAVLRRWWIVAGVVLLATGSAFGLLKLLPPRYTATAEILIERDETEFANLHNGVDFNAHVIDPAEMETHLRVLRSNRIAQQVIGELGLEPEPVQEPAAWRVALDRVKALAGRLAAQAGVPLPAAAPPPPPLSDEERMLREFQDRLLIYRDPLAHVITVGYAAKEPETAARVANGVASAFLDEMVSAQRETLVQTADYLGERVAALGEELEQAERTAKNRRNESDLYQIQGASAAELRYSELMRELSAAEAQLALARARAGGGGGLSPETATPVITELRKQEGEVARRVADAATRFGEKHPVMINSRAELADIRARIREEQGRIGQQVRTELQVAQTRVQGLRNQLAGLERQLTRSTGAQVQIKELETRADATRKMYQDLLERYQRATEQQHILRASARVISAARPPAQPDGKQSLLILGFTGFASLAGGLGLALMLELGRRGFETADQLERETGQPVFGALPLISRRAAGQWRHEIGDSVEAAVYAEAVQRAVVRLLPPGGRSGSEGCQVVAITSALPDEGKTTLSLSLARRLATAGQRVLLIHADLHKGPPASWHETGLQPSHDLVDLLSSPQVRLEDALFRDDRTGLHGLLALSAPASAPRLLASPAMGRVLEEARRAYDMVLVDTPPVLALSDYAAVAGMADQLLFVVRWRTTSRYAVRAALREVTAARLPLNGILLNQVNLGAYRRQAPDETLGYFWTTKRYYRH